MDCDIMFTGKTYVRKEIERKLRLGSYARYSKGDRRCELCGSIINEYGMGSHRNSRKCELAQNLLELYMEGYVLIDNKKLRNYIEKKGYNVRKVPYAAKYNKYYGSYIYHGYFAKGSVVSKYYNYVLPNLKRKPVADKVFETDKYILVNCDKSKRHCSRGRERANDGYRCYEKLEKGMTRKYKFKYCNKKERQKFLYTIDGYLFGVGAKESEMPSKIRKMIMLDEL